MSMHGSACLCKRQFDFTAASETENGCRENRIKNGRRHGEARKRFLQGIRASETENISSNSNASFTLFGGPTFYLSMCIYLYDG